MLTASAPPLTARGRRDPPARRGGGPRTRAGVRQQTSQSSNRQEVTDRRSPKAPPAAGNVTNLQSSNERVLS